MIWLSFVIRSTAASISDWVNLASAKLLFKFSTMVESGSVSACAALNEAWRDDLKLWNLNEKNVTINAKTISY